MALKGKTPWNKGLKGYMAGENHHWSGRDLKNEKSPTWKGDEVGYRGLHIWVQMMLGKPEYCVQCGKNGTGRNMHWANVSREYKRDIQDWIRLCPKCHSAFDAGRRKRKKLIN